MNSGIRNTIRKETTTTKKNVKIDAAQAWPRSKEIQAFTIHKTRHMPNFGKQETH